LILMTFGSAAEASVYVWKDDVNGFTFSFPDSWHVQTSDTPTTRIRIAGPVGQDFATCRVKAEQDGRLKIYPKRLMTDAVEETLNEDFWQGEVAQYESASIHDFRSPASMGGKGDATAIRASYLESKGKEKMTMHSAMLGSIYGDTRYIVSCASKAEVYEKYAPLFATIIGSINLDAKYFPFATGYYRNFLADPKLMLPRSKPGTNFPKNRFFLRTGSKD
jgi:hypothetical protein